MGQSGAERQRLYRERHPERVGQWQREHPTEAAAKSRRWREANPERFRELEVLARARRLASNPHYHRDFARGIRREAIEAYGGACECCGQTQFEFLAIDHINGDGKAERKALGSNLAIFLKLRREGWPKGRHRVLCHNCNMARAFYGECPHNQRAELKVV